MAITGPVVSNDSYVVQQGGFLDISNPGVLANDTTTTGKSLTASLVTDVKNGTLFLSPSGGFIYVPNTNFHGVDGFRYAASDGVQNSTGIVTITVLPTNNTPVARDDHYLVNENSTLTVGAPGILGNDTNPDSHTLTAMLVSNVINGRLTLLQNGSFTYIPNPNFHGVDSFTYKASNGVSSSNTATVVIVVKELSPVSDNLIAKLIEQIQLLFSRISGIESEITDLQKKNADLESRVHQLESHMTNGTNLDNSSPKTSDNEQGDDESGAQNVNPENHDNHGNHEHGNKNANGQGHNDNQDD